MKPTTFMIEKLHSNLERAQNLAKRAWRIYVHPPKETKVYLEPDAVSEIAHEVSKINTDSQPKQVRVVNDQAFVSCMEGQSLQVFDIYPKLELRKEIPFPDQCVELTSFKDLVFATTTNFARPPQNLHNKLWIIDSHSHEVISSVDTQGNWSKVIAVHPSGEYALVSNWHSHNISVISLHDIENPQVIDMLTPPDGRKQLESPRGIAFTDNGEIGLITGFYSKNILEVRQNSDGKFYFSFISPPFDMNGYAGSPRDIVILNPDIALYSNLGTNTIHAWSIPDREVIETIKVGKEPNSIALIGPSKDILAVSCRASKAVYLIETNSLKVVGRSEYTGDTPTGLDALPNGFLVTDFDSANLHHYRF